MLAFSPLSCYMNLALTKPPLHRFLVVMLLPKGLAALEDKAAWVLSAGNIVAVVALPMAMQMARGLA